jgi:hypothetical protein
MSRSFGFLLVAREMWGMLFWQGDVLARALSRARQQNFAVAYPGAGFRLAPRRLRDIKRRSWHGHTETLTVNLQGETASYSTRAAN